MEKQLYPRLCEQSHYFKAPPLSDARHGSDDCVVQLRVVLADSSGWMSAEHGELNVFGVSSFILAQSEL